MGGSVSSVLSVCRDDDDLERFFLLFFFGSADILSESDIKVVCSQAIEAVF
jgi:hypothetical protein